MLVYVCMVYLTVGYHLCRLCSICLEEDCDLGISKDMSESSCGLFEGTQHLILEKLRWRVGVGEERERERINDAVSCDDCVAWGVDE